ncbi:MAG: hypothetical protein FJZ66_10280 [Bacteroidetes bacterium]|nr:hypothetical protein [Bacteroidota bacterium]
MIKLSLLFFYVIFLFSCSKDKVEYYPNTNCNQEVSFSQDILPLINQECTGCHNNQNGYSLTNYDNISANSKAIIGAMRANNYQLMPKGGPMLSDSVIQLMECWVNQGKLNN